MHVTVSRVLGFLLFLALIAYAFFVGPRISDFSLRPAVGTGSSERMLALVDPAPYATVHLPLTRAE